MEETRKKTDIWTVCIYLILYSIAGFVIETVFGIFTKGVVESRKSFLYGPFCAIYGIGAIAMILGLKNQKNPLKLFLGGAVIGAIVEYAMSFFCEKFFGVKWWDYSDFFLNIAGRTCLFFAVSWGFLAIVLMKWVNPQVDRWIEGLKQRKMMFKVATVLLIAFFTVDATLTGYALKVFYYRISTENNLNVMDKKEIQKEYAKIQSGRNFARFVNDYYNDEKMLKTYPNLMIEEQNENTVYVESLIDGVESYYYRLGEAF